jgi:hypothetical protein
LQRLLWVSVLVAAFIGSVRFFFAHSADSSAVFRNIVSIRSMLGMKNKVVAGNDGWLFFEPELTYVTDSLPKSNIEKIVRFDRTLREHGILLFVVPIPNKIEIYPERFSSIPVSQPVKAARQCIINELEKTGVRVIDLVPVFCEAKTRGVAVFNPFETHWTALGMEAAAKEIARRIEPFTAKRGIPASSFYTVNDTVLRATGDLIGRICNDEKSTWYSLPVKRVLCPDGSLYTDDRKSRIMILGDSFVNHGKWWNAHLGAQIARFLGRPTRTCFSLLANTEGPCMYSLKPSQFPVGGIVIWAFTSRALQYRLGVPEDTSTR